MRLRASLLVNLIPALLARAQADNAVSVNGLSSVPRPTDPWMTIEFHFANSNDHKPRERFVSMPRELHPTSSCERLVGAGT
jgi:hypothetical protein